MKTLIAFLLLSGTAMADPRPGFERLAVDAAHRARPLDAAIWYPAASETYRASVGANPVFSGTYVEMGAAVEPGPHPLVIISHGSGGNIENLGWLAEGLVARGAIVAGVNHQGATSGDSSPRQVVRVWDRTKDIAALMAAMGADPAFAANIDMTQITVLGFSLGGATVLAAGGARFDSAAIGAYCDRYGNDASECLFMARGGVDPHALPPEIAGDMRVAGIARVIAVEPAFSHTFVAESLLDLPPVHLIRMGGPDVIPPARNIGPEGSDLAGRIPAADLTTIAPAWHFSFLGLCTPEARAMLAAEGDDPICDDPAGVDRAAVHEAVIADIAGAMGL
jgi:predicted dienelactone hydrolase